MTHGGGRLAEGDELHQALRQIRENDHAKPYLADGRPAWAIGLNFDSKTRALTDAAHERLA